jgi:hypothetical protein
VNRLITYLKHNALGAIALFIALGGTSYAAVAIPRDSVGSRQLRTGAVTSTKIHSGAVTPGKLSSAGFGGRILYFAEIENNGVVETSDPRAVKTEDWTLNSGGGEVVFPHRIPKGCFPLATGGTEPTGAGTSPIVGSQISNSTMVQVRVSGVSPVTLAIVCGR